MSNRLIRSIWGILWAAIFLLAACEDPSFDNTESSNPEVIAHDSAHGSAQKEEFPAISPTTQPTESEMQQAEVQENLLPDPAEEEPPKEMVIEEVDWGREINLAEMITKAKSGEIREIQWHVMPNILRAQAVDNRIFHLRNENKGVDLRNTLISAGVQVGKGGVTFRHVF